MMPEKEIGFAEGKRVVVRTICGVILFGLAVVFAMIYLQYGIVSTYTGDAQREFFWLLGIGSLMGYFFVTACFGRFIWILPESKVGSEDLSR